MPSKSPRIYTAVVVVVAAAAAAATAVMPPHSAHCTSLLQITDTMSYGTHYDFDACNHVVRSCPGELSDNTAR